MQLIIDMQLFQAAVYAMLIGSAAIVIVTEDWRL